MAVSFKSWDAPAKKKRRRIDEPETPSHIREVDWDEFLDLMDWEQGQHVTLIGRTGSGKTTLINQLLQFRDYIIFLGSKRADTTQDELAGLGFKTVSNPHEINPQVNSRWVVRPPFPTKASATELKELHRDIFRETLMRAYRDGSWTIVIDEARYMAENLKLTPEMNLLWLQGRSQGNSVVAGAQRPRYIPLEAYDQADHLFFFKENDVQNVRRAAETAGVNQKAVARAVASLDWHEFVYIKPKQDLIVISKYEME